MYRKPCLRDAIRGLCLTAFAIALVCGRAPAAEYVVAPTGNDAANGSKASPFRTISKGVSVLKAGDTLFIAPGEYEESVTVSVAGTEESPVSIVGVEAPSILPPEGDGIIVRQSSHISLRGLKVTKASGAGIVITESRNVTVAFCISGENTGPAVRTSLSDHVSLEKCELYGSKEAHGIHLSATDHPEVLDCKIRENALCGVYLSGDASAGGDGMITGAFIARNFVMDNGAKGGSAIKLEGVEKSVIERNVVDNNLSGGIEARKGGGARAGSGNRFISNVVRFKPATGAFGFKLTDASTRARIEGSVVSIDNGPSISVDEKSSPRFRALRNFYTSTGGESFFEWKGARLNFTAWRQATGQDADSHSAAMETRVVAPAAADPAEETHDH